SITAAASILGIGQAPLRYDPRVTEVQSTRLERVASSSSASVAEAATSAACNAETPIFVNGMASLKQQLGEVMGSPAECEHPADTVGVTVQQTSTGLAVSSKLTGLVTFTDGWHHWALSTDGDVVSWEGTQ